MEAMLLLDQPIAISKRLGQALGLVESNEPQFVETMPRPGDALILQGERLNVMIELLDTPDLTDLPRRGFHISAPITTAQKEAALAKFHSRWASHRRVKDDGASDHLSASLVDAKAHMATLGNRRMPVTR